MGWALAKQKHYIKPVFSAVTKSSPNSFLAPYSEFFYSKIFEVMSCLTVCKIFLPAKVKFGSVILEFMLATDSAGKTFGDWLSQCSSTFAHLEKEKQDKALLSWTQIMTFEKDKLEQMISALCRCKVPDLGKAAYALKGVETNLLASLSSAVVEKFNAGLLTSQDFFVKTCGNAPTFLPEPGSVNGEKAFWEGCAKHPMPQVHFDALRSMATIMKTHQEFSQKEERILNFNQLMQNAALCMSDTWFQPGRTF